MNTNRYRRSPRLHNYDYSQSGAYFVTICTRIRDTWFGDVIADEVHLNSAGEIVRTQWLDLPKHFPQIELDAWVVMPDHIHGIIVLLKDDSHELPQVIAGYKSGVSRQLREQGIVEGSIWQRSFYDRIIRNEAECNRIRAYIENNPSRWAINRNGER